MAEIKCCAGCGVVLKEDSFSINDRFYCPKCYSEVKPLNEWCKECKRGLPFSMVPACVDCMWAMFQTVKTGKPIIFEKRVI